jgi:hypothetical protein
MMRWRLGPAEVLLGGSGGSDMDGLAERWGRKTQADNAFADEANTAQPTRLVRN